MKLSTFAIDYTFTTDQMECRHAIDHPSVSPKMCIFSKRQCYGRLDDRPWHCCLMELDDDEYPDEDTDT